MKYGKRIINRIFKLVESDDYTIAEICQQVNISQETFCKWRREKSEFADGLKNADEKRLDTFKAAARSGLMKLLKGHEWEETITEYIPGEDQTPVIRSQRKVKKFSLPNPVNVIFALKSLDSENFKDIVKQEHSGPGGAPIPAAQTLIVSNVDYKQLPTEVLEAIVRARIKEPD